jgi:hypothetical protein
MTGFKLFGAALILSTAFATPVFAQSAGLPELPGDYDFLYPDGEPRIGGSGAGDVKTAQPGDVMASAQPAQVGGRKKQFPPPPGDDKKRD